ncbi:MAG TPA: hypothetical protein ENI76_10775 [Ignavibacteria bacterium]|nr:hypothetical protein [Ignavibacteria bacterium]
MSNEDPWEHRSSGMLCKSCMWYAEKIEESVKIGGIGRCRRHSPTLNGYPVVISADWCGDHKLSENVS